MRAPTRPKGGATLHFSRFTIRSICAPTAEMRIGTFAAGAPATGLSGRLIAAPTMKSRTGGERGRYANFRPARAGDAAETANWMQKHAKRPRRNIRRGRFRLSKKLRFFDKGDCTPKGSRFSSKSCRTFWGVKCDFRCACPRKSRFKFYFAAACARRRVSERNRRLRRLLARRCGETLRGLFPASGGFLTRSCAPSVLTEGALA